MCNRFYNIFISCGEEVCNRVFHHILAELFRKTCFRWYRARKVKKSHLSFNISICVKSDVSSKISPSFPAMVKNVANKFGFEKLYVWSMQNLHKLFSGVDLYGRRKIQKCWKGEMLLAFYLFFSFWICVVSGYMFFPTPYLWSVLKKFLSTQELSYS